MINEEFDDAKEEASRIRKKVRDGDSNAMVILGIMYWNGNGVNQDFDRAINYWNRAAEKGNADGYLWLGKINFEESAEKAKPFLVKAAKLGNEEAQKLLDKANAREVDEFYEKGMMLYSQYANYIDREYDVLNDEYGAFYVSDAYYNEVKDSFKYLMKAAEKGNNNAITQILYMYRIGHGKLLVGEEEISFFSSKKNKSLEEFLIKGARLENPLALYILGIVRVKASGGKQEQLEKGVDYLVRSAKKGCCSASLELANLYSRGYGDLDEEEEENKVLEYYIKAGDNGDAYGYLLLGEFIKDRDFKSAVEYYSKGIDYKIDEKFEKYNIRLLNESEKINLSQRIAKTFEEEFSDLENAKKWYKKAKKLGSTSAQIELNRIFEIEHPNVSRTVKAVARTIEEQTVTYANDNGDWEKRMSNKSGNGGCFITTAVCDSFGKKDDCYELTMFREFRDNWLAVQVDGDELIREYYAIAPQIVLAISHLSNAMEVYQSIWDKYLSKCLHFIEQGQEMECKEKYVEMVQSLKKKYIDISLR